MRNHHAMGWVSLLAIYLLWGTGCLAIKVCLDGGFGPFGLGATRLFSAAALIGLYGWWSRSELVRSELPRILGAGALYWVVGSGLQVWGQQTVSSGAAALILGLTPLVGALMSGPNLRTLACLGLGLAGLGLAVDGPIQGEGVLALTAAAVVLALASRTLGELHSGLGWVAGLQLGIGGAGQLGAMLVAGEALPTPTADAWIAWVWLVVGPAVLGMLAFVHAARTLPLTTVLSHALVNPVVALVLGWAVLAEPLGLPQWAGLALVLVGVGALIAQPAATVRTRRSFGLLRRHRLQRLRRERRLRSLQLARES